MRPLRCPALSCNVIWRVTMPRLRVSHQLTGNGAQVEAQTLCRSGRLPRWQPLPPRSPAKPPNTSSAHGGKSRSARRGRTKPRRTQEACEKVRGHLLQKGLRGLLQVTPNLQSPVRGLAWLRLHVERPGHVTRASDPKSLTQSSYCGCFPLSVCWAGESAGAGDPAEELGWGGGDRAAVPRR